MVKSKHIEGGGVVKSVSFKSISPWFKPTWFKAHCDHFLKSSSCLRYSLTTNALGGVKLAHAAEHP